MDALDEKIARHLARTLADWRTRLLISGMIIQDNGDITAFVEGYRMACLKMWAEEEYERT